MNAIRYLHAFTWIFILIHITPIVCWTDEDLQLFDLVENTDRKFYDILGVDQKASANDIRKAYRKLSQQYHPDRNKDPNAEEMFRKIAAISEVLRNEDLRKKYDIILQTGLPDWREPIYYYRRVRNMGLYDLIIFLFCLATIGQHLFAWSVYWEKKYEIEELISSKIRRKTKFQRKAKSVKAIEEMEQSQMDMCNIPKPRCQDLFPVQLIFLLIRIIKSLPSLLMWCLESLQSLWKPSQDENGGKMEGHFKGREVRPRVKKHVEPIYPELNEEQEVNHNTLNNGTFTGLNGELQKAGSKKSDTSEESDMNEFKKAMKKFPNGTLQRWEKIAEYLKCSVPQVITMTKQMKVQQFSRNVPISTQGLTGLNDFHNDTSGLNGKVEQDSFNYDNQNGVSHVPNGNGTIVQRSSGKGDNCNSADVLWKQEEQRSLELALQKYSKDTPARWDRIAEFVQTKTRDECIARYKWLAQEIKRKKNKEN